MFNIFKKKKVHEEDTREPEHWVNGVIGDAYYSTRKSYTLIAPSKKFTKEERKLIEEGWGLNGEPIAINDQGDGAILQRFTKSEVTWLSEIVVHSYNKKRLIEYVKQWKEFGYVEKGEIESKGIIFLQDLVKKPID